jgi:hypothetical protein
MNGREKSTCQFTDLEFDRVRIVLQSMGRVVIADVEAVLGITAYRARELLGVVARTVGTRKTRGSPISVWEIREDVEEKITARKAMQAKRIEKRNTAHKKSVEMAQERERKVGPTWEGRSAAPTHFDTDGMGRVIAYRGPIQTSRYDDWADVDFSG